MSNKEYTAAEIKKMPAAGLRAAVKAHGKDPMSAEFAKGNVEKLKAFLLAKIPAAKPAPKAAPKPAAAPKLEEQIGDPSVPDPAIGELHVTVAGLETRLRDLEMRMGTVETANRVASGTVIPAGDPFEPIRAFIVEAEEGLSLNITASDVDALDHNQLLAVVAYGRQGGSDIPGAETMGVRELRQAVHALLATATEAQGASEPETAAEEPASDGVDAAPEATAEDAPTWPDEIDPAWLEPGAVVRILVPSEPDPETGVTPDPTLYEPCVVQEQILSEDGTAIEKLKVFIDGEDFEVEDINDRFGEMEANYVIGFSEKDLQVYNQLPG